MSSKKQRVVLIIEDEEPLRKILRSKLKENNFEIIEAENGKEGVEQALRDHPDLILLDLLMPEMNGMSALKKIRQDEWGTKVPVIILTNLSADNEQLVKDMITEHPICYIIKSDWKIEDVIKKVKEVLLK
jgi:DNA-binding response OmpR family regulator